MKKPEELPSSSGDFVRLLFVEFLILRPNATSELKAGRSSTL